MVLGVWASGREGKGSGFCRIRARTIHGTRTARFSFTVFETSTKDLDHHAIFMRKKTYERRARGKSEERKKHTPATWTCECTCNTSIFTVEPHSAQNSQYTDTEIHGTLVAKLPVGAMRRSSCSG